jgi:transposase
MTKQWSIYEKVDFLMSRVEYLEKENSALRFKVDELTERLSKYETPKNSGNSNKPPSSDFPKVLKTQSLREPSGKKPGGQPGHKGTTLKMSDNPDIILNHSPNNCICCGEDLTGYEAQLTGSRQVIDIPPIKPVITEHDVYKIRCRCGHENTAAFPEGIVSPVCYGPNTQSLVAYLSTRQYIPVERTAELMSNVFGLPISTGGVCYLLEKVRQKAVPVYEAIRQLVLRGNVIGADETGVNINGKNNWAWAFQNPKATYIAIHKSRGHKAIAKIMPEGFENNILVTDCWASYFKDNAACHQLCTAHLLRELKFFIEKYPENTWVQRMNGLIVNALEMRRENKLTPPKSAEVTRTFLVLIQEPASQKIKELITFQDRMVKYSGYVFAFLKNPEIPPDNNGSERAIRNFKVKQKISGLFRSTSGAEIFATLRSLIDTAIKQGQNPYENLHAISLLASD